MAWEDHKKMKLTTRKKREAADKRQERASRKAREKEKQERERIILEEMKRTGHAIGLLISSPNGKAFSLMPFIGTFASNRDNSLGIPEVFFKELPSTSSSSKDFVLVLTGPEDLRTMIREFREQGLTCIEIAPPQ